MLKNLKEVNGLHILWHIQLESQKTLFEVKTPLTIQKKREEKKKDA